MTDGTICLCGSAAPKGFSYHLDNGQQRLASANERASSDRESTPSYLDLSNQRQYCKEPRRNLSAQTHPLWSLPPIMAKDHDAHVETRIVLTIRQQPSAVRKVGCTVCMSKPIMITLLLRAFLVALAVEPLQIRDGPQARASSICLKSLNCPDLRWGWADQLGMHKLEKL